MVYNIMNALLLLLIIETGAAYCQQETPLELLMFEHENINKSLNRSFTIEQTYFPECSNLVSYDNISRLCLPIFGTCFEIEHACYVIDTISDFNCTDTCCKGSYDYGGIFTGRCNFCCDDNTEEYTTNNVYLLLGSLTVLFGVKLIYDRLFV